MKMLGKIIGAIIAIVFIVLPLSALHALIWQLGYGWFAGPTLEPTFPEELSFAQAWGLATFLGFVRFRHSEADAAANEGKTLSERMGESVAVSLTLAALVLLSFVIIHAIIGDLP